MDFWKTMGVLLRRWYVSVPVFVISLVLAGGAFFAVHTQYESTGTIVLTAPTAGGVTAVNPADATGPGNPLLDFEGSLTITTQLLIQSLSSPTVQNQVGAQGGVGTFQAGDGETGGPFVVIIADAPSKAQAEKTVSLALKYAQTELNTRQKNLDAPPSTFIGTQVVVAPTPAITKIGSKVKAGGVVFALGLVLGLAAAFAFESVATNRRRRKADEAADYDDESHVDTAVDDDEESNAERSVKTHKMTPAPPPRQLPQPVRSGAAGGQRPAPRPQVGPIGVNGRRDPFPGPVHKQHPAKPHRVHPMPPAPAAVPNKGQNSPTNGPNKPPNNNVNNNNVNNNGANNNGANKNVHNGANNAAANQNTQKTNSVNNPVGANNGASKNGRGHDWPRSEFRSPDSSNG
ncbi:MAG TPA: hypothetical protein VFX16_18840 [Pseudonocardiaceae bacterium]|nr:hypothetical protein [Pseudonocardiaceae bacterium]